MKIDPRFEVSPDECIHCDHCINVCAGIALRARSDGIPEIQLSERYGWHSCWRCQHYLAAYPTGTVSIFGKEAEGSLPPPPKEMGTYIGGLVTNRHSCCHCQKENVNSALVTRMLKSMAAAPAGGDYCNVEYTIVDDKDRVEEVRRIVYKIMEENAKRHIYTNSSDDFYYAKVGESEQSIRKDNVLFCEAPHPFIVHAE